MANSLPGGGAWARAGRAPRPPRRSGTRPRRARRGFGRSSPRHWASRLRRDQRGHSGCPRTAPRPTSRTAGARLRQLADRRGALGLGLRPVCVLLEASEASSTRPGRRGLHEGLGVVSSGARPRRSQGLLAGGALPRSRRTASSATCRCIDDRLASSDSAAGVRGGGLPRVPRRRAAARRWRMTEVSPCLRRVQPGGVEVRRGDLSLVEEEREGVRRLRGDGFPLAPSVRWGPEPSPRPRRAQRRWPGSRSLESRVSCAQAADGIETVSPGRARRKRESSPAATIRRRGGEWSQGCVAETPSSARRIARVE